MEVPRTLRKKQCTTTSKAVARTPRDVFGKFWTGLFHGLIYVHIISAWYLHVFLLIVRASVR